MTPDPLESARGQAAEELGLDPESFLDADLGLDAWGTGEGEPPVLELVVEEAEETRRIRIPDRFVADDFTIDVAALATWLGIPDADALPSELRPTHEEPDDADDSGWGFWDEDEDRARVFWLTGRAPQIVLPIPDVSPATAPGDPVLTDADKSPVAVPELGDTDAWPDDVEGWLVVIDQLAKNARGTLRAADVRALYGGHDDTVLELRPEGPVDDQGDVVDPEASDRPAISEDIPEWTDDAPPPVGPRPDSDRPPDPETDGDVSSFDPETDILDAAMEEAMRIRGLPGAMPPPEEQPTTGRPTPEADREAPGDEDRPVVEIDNTVAIVDEPEVRYRRWDLGAWLSTTWVWIILWIVAIVLMLLLVAWLRSDGEDTTGAPDDAVVDNPTDDTPAEDGEPAADDTAEDVLRQATQELLDARTAELEQLFSVAGTSGSGQSVAATGGVDFETAISQSTFETQGTSFTAYVAPDSFAFDTGTGWVETERGEIGGNEEAQQAGLEGFAVAEAMDPAGVAALLAAAEDVEQSGDNSFAFTVTLPVEGADGLVQGIYGNPQEDLAGLVLPLEVEFAEDGSVSVSVVFELEDAIDFLADDPLAATLAGITLTNEIRFTAPGADVALAGPDAAARNLDTLLDQLG